MRAVVRAVAASTMVIALLAGFGPASADTASAVEAELDVASTRGGSGYWMLGVTGSVYDFGDAEHHGGVETYFPNCWRAIPVGFCDLPIDIEPHPEGYGYWILHTVGTVEYRGDAPDGYIDAYLAPRYGDPWMSVSATDDALGLYVFSAFGCVHAEGTATFLGDRCGRPLNAPIVGSAVTPSGNGYYMLAADGGVFTFGDARFYGSTGRMRLNAPVVDMVVSPTGNGYWLVAEDGGIFAFGDARFYGSMGAVRLNAPVIGMVGSPSGGGYLMVGMDGGIFTFGDVRFHGSLGSTPPEMPIVSVAVRP